MNLQRPWTWATMYEKLKSRSTFGNHKKYFQRCANNKKQRDLPHYRQP